MTPDNLQDRETSRRKALWTLAHLPPGDPKAVAVIQVLDEIAVKTSNRLTIPFRPNEFRNVIETEARSNELQIIHEARIPQHWRERFLQASRGSTRRVEGPYLSAMTNVECMAEAVKLPVEAFACRPRDPGRPESKVSTADREFSNPQLTALKSRLVN